MKGKPDYSGRSNHFWFLFDYISGYNSDLKKIDRSTPVLMKLKSNISTTDDKYGVMSFFLGYKFKEGEVAP